MNVNSSQYYIHHEICTCFNEVALSKKVFGEYDEDTNNKFFQIFRKTPRLYYMANVNCDDHGNDM